MALMSPCQAAEIELEGVVKAIDATARTLTIERKKKTLELEVAPKAGDLSAVKVGQRIAFTYDSAIEIITKIRGDAAAKATRSSASVTPGPNDALIAKTVASSFAKHHFLKPTIDDAMASRWFEAFLEALDPMKLYLTAADIKKLAEKRTSLDDMLHDGDVSFAYDAQALLCERVDQRLPLIERLIEGDHDFAKAETITVDRDATTWAADDAEAEDLWRRRIKFDLLTQKMEQAPLAEAKDKLLRRYRSFGTRMHQMTADEILELYLASLGSSLDPHTTYMSPGTLENFEIGMKLQLDGIGAQLKGEDGYTKIVELTPGGAADKDGRLKAEDRVLAIGQGDDGELVDVVDMNLNEVVKLIRGKRGTVVRLKVLPLGSTVPRTYTITRAKIELQDAKVFGEVFEAGTKADGNACKVGVIRVPSLYMDMAAAGQGKKDFKSCARDVQKLLEGFRLQNVKCVVLDLRGNGGGMIPEAIRLAGLFIDRGPIVQVEDAEKQLRPYDDVEGGAVWDGPLLVLVNQFTLGCPEVVAGAIQDYRRGVVVGDRTTAGHGMVKSLFDVGKEVSQRGQDSPKLGAMKVSVQQIFRPSGESIQWSGVQSDVPIPSMTAVLPVGESSLRNAVAKSRVNAASFASADLTSESIVKKLRDASRARVAASQEFRALEARLSAHDASRQRKEVSLAERDFEKSWSEGSGSQADQQQPPVNARGAITRDYYLDEVLNVAADYTAALAH